MSSDVEHNLMSMSTFFFSIRDGPLMRAMTGPRFLTPPPPPLKSGHASLFSRSRAIIFSVKRHYFLLFFLIQKLFIFETKTEINNNNTQFSSQFGHSLFFNHFCTSLIYSNFTPVSVLQFLHSFFFFKELCGHASLFFRSRVIIFSVRLHFFFFVRSRVIRFSWRPALPHILRPGPYVINEPSFIYFENNVKFRIRNLTPFFSIEFPRFGHVSVELNH